jgi:hypothetical protein
MINVASINKPCIVSQKVASTELGSGCHLSQVVGHLDP